jgi:hypothetical protein
LIPGFDGAVFSYEWKEALWGHCKKMTAAYGRSERSGNLRLWCCFGTGERLVERALADLRPPGCLAHRQPRRDECPGAGELLGRDRRLATAFAAARLGRFQTGACALADEVALELRERAEQMKDERAAGRGGVDAFGE